MNEMRHERPVNIVNLRDVPPGTAIVSDICIVGSGPAAFALANELANTRHQVLIVESGAANGEQDFSVAQNEIESVGAPRVMDQTKVRNRVLGGASHTWSGRCTTFDEIDFETRPWVPFSGWPLRAQDIEASLEKAAHTLGLLPTEYGDRLLQHFKLPQRFDSHPSEVRSVFWQFSRRSASDRDHMRFGPRYGELEASTIRVLTHATVTEILSDDEGSQVRALRVSTPERAMHEVQGRLFVLCAGGIENPRLLLASNRVHAHGIGNRKGLVGRFLMDHPRTVIGTFAPASAQAIQPEFFLLRHTSGYRMQRGLSLSLDVQRREQLLNCAAWITQHFAEDDAWIALRSARQANPRNLGSQLRIAARHADQVVAGAWNQLVRRRPVPRRHRQIDVDVLVEQMPDPSSRISLSDRRDALGVPISRVDWKIGEMERRTVMRLAHAMNESLRRAGLPSVTLADWIREGRPEAAAFRDVAHPIGTTRMAESETQGVVDPQCRVFGVSNLYVAGSSVFPTSGHANPTLMIAALSIRLAETLRQANAA